MYAGHPGRVELLPGNNFETALRGLDGFERAWLLFLFDRNKSWRPTTRPPVTGDVERVGVFASRSPYRPNPIGLSCVRILGIHGRTLYVDEADLLDRTPVLDIKPYVPKADAFPNAKAGWVDTQTPECWTVLVSPECTETRQKILALGGMDVVEAARVQLRENPEDTSRKRVDIEGDRGTLSLRMFRIKFHLDRRTRTISLRSIESGYTEEELLPGTLDPYGDKNIHRGMAR